MRSLPLATALAITATTAMAADTQQYDFDDFNAVEVSAGITVTIERGEDYSVEAEAKRGRLRRLEITQSGNTLDIDRRTSWGILGLGRRDRFEVTITLPELEFAKASSGSSMDITGQFDDDLGLEASSGASMSFDGTVSDDLEIDASSGASVSAHNLTIQDLTVEATSGASVSLSGTCDNIDAEADSGASLSAKSLECRTTDADSGGGASLSVYATDKAKAHASGGASLSVHGKPPIVESSASGGASISIR